MGRSTKFGWFLVLVQGLVVAAGAQERRSALELIALANAHSAALRAAIEASFDMKDVRAGAAWAGHGPDFFFAVESGSTPSLVIDDSVATEMTELAGTQLWY